MSVWSGKKRRRKKGEKNRSSPSIDSFLTSIKLSSRIASTTFSTRWLFGWAIPSSVSTCAASSELLLAEREAEKLRKLDCDEEEERAIIVCHSAAEGRAAATELINLVEPDAEAELVDAPAPAAAREQREPSAASRAEERAASWAAARRSIVFSV